MKNNFVRFSIPFLISAVLIFLVLFAFSGSARVAARTAAAPSTTDQLIAAADPITITYWHHNTGDREIFLTQLIDEFNGTNGEDIIVQGVYIGGYSDLHTAVISGLQHTGPLPNLVVGYPNSFAEYASYGGVRFLDEYINDPVIGITDTNDFYPAILEYYSLGEYGGQTAGLQNGRSIELMFYNADILASMSITVPQTWDAYQTACISVTSETVTGTALSVDPSRFATWLWSRGGEVLSNDVRRARFHEQPGIDSLTFFQGQIQDGTAWIPEESYGNQIAFTNGEAAFTFGSSSGIPYYRSGMDSGAQQAWGVARSPAIPGNEVVNFYGAGSGILHHSEDENQAAWIFLKWLTDRDQTARWAARSGYFPVRVSAESHISITQKLDEDPQYSQAFDLQPLGKSEPAVRAYVAIRDVIDDAMWQILGEGADVTSTLEAAAEETDAILATSPSSSEVTSEGGTVIYTDTQGLSATVDIPAGALAVTETISYVPLENLPTNGLAFALLPDLVFGQPVTVTLRYRDEDVTGMDEDALILYNYDWATNSWVDANPCGGYLRDPENNILQACVCHFSDYAMFDWLSKIFLPNIQK